MGSVSVSVRISSCHLSSLSLSLNPTVTMLFLPRLTLLLFIAFLGFCCLTQVKAGNLPTCKSLEAQCKKENKNELIDCDDGIGIKCIMSCIDNEIARACFDSDGNVVSVCIGANTTD